MPKLFKDATTADLFALAKGLRDHLTGPLGFAKAEVDFKIDQDGPSIAVRFTDIPNGSLYDYKWAPYHSSHPSWDDELDAVVASVWSKVNEQQPADKRHLQVMMRQLGDTLEATEAYQEASVVAFRDRIRSMRDDLGARLLEAPQAAE